MDLCVSEFVTSKVDYLNNGSRSYPDGANDEVFTVAALAKTSLEATTAYDREHVTTYIRNTKTFSKKELFSNIDYSDQRWTVDTAEDLIVIRNIFSEFCRSPFWLERSIRVAAVPSFGGL